MTSTFVRHAVVLGLLFAIGPFAIDMYLPALPEIGRSLATDAASVQASLLAFFAAIAVFQLVYGPISDMVGRKAPLYFGLTLFAIGSVGCALAPNIETLIAFRFLQGIGACANMMMPRAIMRDLYTGNQAARLMSLLMLVFSVSPILAPLFGSFLVEALGWRSVFWAILGIGIAGFALVAFFLPETLPPEKRQRTGWGTVVGSYWVLLRDARFMGLSLIAGFGIAGFFTFLVNSPFVFQDHYGLSPTMFSVAFSINAVAFIGVAQANGWLAERYGQEKLVLGAASLFALLTVALFGLQLAGVDNMYVLIAMLFVGFGALGLVIPSTSVLALDDHGAIAGSAAALSGTLQLVVAAFLVPVVAVFFDGTPTPMVGGIAFAALVALALSWLTLARRREAVGQPAE